MSKKKKKYTTPLGYQLELIKKELPDEYEKLMELLRTTKQQKVMNKEEAKDELINVLYSQVIDLTMMSKIELGDDVISEIKRLKEIINEQTR